VREKMRGTPSGEFAVKVNGSELRVHYWAFVIEGRVYYTVIEVVSDILSRVVNMNHFSLGVLVLCLMTLVAVYYNIYMQGKHRIGIFKE
jgi:hypothetical protein